MNQADYRELYRLRKDELIRLYSLSGLTGSTEELTKSDIINSIISARIDDEEVPPSSPPGKTEDGYSTDEGNDGGGEETDAVRPLRRRSTVQEITRTVKRTAAALGRSLSLGQNDKSLASAHQKKCARISEDVRSPVHREFMNGTSRYVITPVVEGYACDSSNQAAPYSVQLFLTSGIIRVILSSISTRYSSSVTNYICRVEGVIVTGIVPCYFGFGTRKEEACRLSI